jgi:CRP/FNR family transcriptional regulator
MILSEKIYKLSDIENGFLSMKNYDLFVRLTKKEYQELDLANSVMEAKKRTYIYSESQYFNKLFFIKGDCIKIGYIDNSGKEILLQGEVFGQFSLQRNNMNGEFAQAHKCDVTLCAFTIDNFRKLLQQNTSIAVGYSKKVSNRLRKIENRLVKMLHVDVKTRLVRFL